jgi:hypothetical protein
LNNRNPESKEFPIQGLGGSELIKLSHTKMPYGKYEGRYLIDIPEYYIVWYSNKGFPKGELGQQLQLIYELKLNGLEELIRNIKKQYPKP